MNGKAQTYIVMRENNHIRPSKKMSRDEVKKWTTKETGKLVKRITQNFPEVKILNALNNIIMVIISVPTHINAKDIEKKCNCKLTKDREVKLL